MVNNPPHYLPLPMVQNRILKLNLKVMKAIILLIVEDILVIFMGVIGVSEIDPITEEIEATLEVG